MLISLAIYYFYISSNTPKSLRNLITFPLHNPYLVQFLYCSGYCIFFWWPSIDSTTWGNALLLMSGFHMLYLGMLVAGHFLTALLRVHFPTIVISCQTLHLIGHFAYQFQYNNLLRKYICVRDIWNILDSHMRYYFYSFKIYN